MANVGSYSTEKKKSTPASKPEVIKMIWRNI